MKKQKTNSVIENKIVKRKIWTFEELEHEDGMCVLNRTCEGFTVNELLGLLYRTQIDIMEQLKGEHRPDVITRTYIKE